MRLSVCIATALARDAAARHRLAPGSAAVLAQGLTAALLLAALEGARVDVQLECNGPVRGFLVDGDETGAVRGLIRINDVPGPLLPPEGARIDPRPLLASPHDERAGMISILRGPAGTQTAHRAAYPFAGSDLGAALTLFLRSERVEGGELALEVLGSTAEPLAAVAGASLTAVEETDAERARAFGKPLRQGGLCAALQDSADAGAVAEKLARSLDLGSLQPVSSLEPRFRCRCSRERVVTALRSLGAAQLREMAEKDGGARLSCDFCAAAWQFTAAELRALSAGSAS